MAKDIVIQDEYFKTVHMSGVTRLRTDLEGGGECYWVPEDEEMVLIGKSVSANGTYIAMNDDANGYSAVTVNVENVYDEHDEGRVVSNGALVDQSSRTITTNGTYDTTTNNSITVETSSNLSTKTITVNGTYAASSDNVDGYSDVTVSVPNTYTQSDEGKVVSHSALVSQSSRTITTNGTYDTTTNNSITVETSSNLSTKTITVNGTYAASSDNVDGYSDVTVSVPNTYTQSDEGKVVSNSALVSQSSRTITTNGTYDTTTNNSITVETSSNLSTKTITVNGTYQASSDNVDGYSDVTVSVSNTYTHSDEGKVVSNSALVSQSSRTITTNGTYDTTTNNSITVETSSNLSTKTITVNGTYAASSDNVDGYSDVTVSVPNTYTQSDEGKVVSNSALVDQSSRTITTNGTYDTTTNNSITVSLSNTFDYYLDNGKVVSRLGLVSQSSLTIVSDGEYDTTFYNAVKVSVTGVVLDFLEASVNDKYYNASEYGVSGFDVVFVSIPLMNEVVTFSENGYYYANDYGYEGFTSAYVDVPQLSLSGQLFSENGTYSASDYGYDGFSEVTIDVQPNLTYSTFSENGTYYASGTGYDGFSEVTIDVQPNLTYSTFSENGTYSSSDYGYDGFSEITISVPDSAASVVERTIEYFENSEISTIGKYAFAGCTNLQTVSVPNCCAIESGAFYECGNLEYLYLLARDTMVTISDDPFSNSGVPTIYVAPEFVTSYKTDAYWGIYSDYIEPYEE